MLLIFNLAKQSSNLSLSGWATKKEEGPGERLGERRGGGVGGEGVCRGSQGLHAKLESQKISDLLID